jgi:hypothetical protein
MAELCEDDRLILALREIGTTERQIAARLEMPFDRLRSRLAFLRSKGQFDASPLEGREATLHRLNAARRLIADVLGQRNGGIVVRFVNDAPVSLPRLKCLEGAA